MGETEKALREHVAKFHVQQTCPYCEHIFKNKNNLRTHFYKCKTKKAASNQDEGSSKAGTNSGNAKEKNTSNKKHDTFEKVCDLCLKKFHSKGGYYKHKNKIHKDDIVINDVGQVIILE